MTWETLIGIVIGFVAGFEFHDIILRPTARSLKRHGWR